MRAYPKILKENRLPQNANIIHGRENIESFFHNNIVEVVFRRRIIPPWKLKDREVGHFKYKRRMLCTANWRFISSPLTRKYFNWKRPSSRRGKMWYRQRKLVIVWDIMMNNWRMVSLDKWAIAGYYPAQKMYEKAKFISFYRQMLMNMPKTQKLHFSDLIDD